MKTLEIGSKYIQQQKRVGRTAATLIRWADFNGRKFIIRLERIELHAALFLASVNSYLYENINCFIVQFTDKLENKIVQLSGIGIQIHLINRNDR